MSDLESPQSPEQSGEQAPPPVPPPVIPVPAPPVTQQSYTPPPIPPAPRKSRSGAFFLGALSGCLVLAAGMVFLMIVVAAVSDDSDELSFATEKVAIVPIEGEIFEARETLDTLHRFARNQSVKAIVVRINSPGGAIAPSQEIYSAIRRIRADTGKPIVASMDSVAASGGFYIAAACDQIVANPGSITGSIGVILQWFEMKELVKWAKLKPETITSGGMKDAGSPYRELSDAERVYFERIVKQLHKQFIRDVARGRGERLKYEEVERLADGRIFTGEEALELKLVDRLGSIDDAVKMAGKLAGIEGEPARIWPKRSDPSLFDLLTSSEETGTAIERIFSRRLPQFLYRW